MLENGGISDGKNISKQSYLVKFEIFVNLNLVKLQRTHIYVDVIIIVPCKFPKTNLSLIYPYSTSID